MKQARTIAASPFFRIFSVRIFLCALLALFFLFLSTSAHAQPSAPGDGELADSSDNVDEDETTVVLTVRQLGSCEVAAVIQKEEAYLSVKEVFNFLKIKVFATSNNDSVSGYFLNPANRYSVDKINNRVTFNGKVYDLKPGELLRTDANLFLKSSYFNDIFGLECKFDYRSLSITLSTKLDLPAIKEMQNEQMRLNMRQLRGERKVDTTIARDRSLLHIGMADWSLTNSQRFKEYSETRLDLNLGGMVAGGETNAFLSYNSGQKFDWARQFVRWRYVNNANKLLRQVALGTVYTNSTSTLFGNLTGIQLSNTPTVYRRSFGTYRLSDNTEPGWTVELYVNNILIDYTKSDASGFFTFNVPLVYGYSAVKLRFYGPWGEERTKEQVVNIPFNFLPKGEFEYNLTAGVVDDSQKNKFSRLNLNYGLSSRLTVGTGVEYLSSIDSGKFMPFVNASLRLGSGLMITGEHNYGVRSRALVKYQTQSSIQIEASYTKYAAGQTAIRQGKQQPSKYEEERKVSAIFPIRLKRFLAFSRMSYSELQIAGVTQRNTEMLFSGNVRKVGVNVTTTSTFTDPKRALIFTDFALSFRMPHGIRVTPQLRYEWQKGNAQQVKAEFEKAFTNRGFLNVIYERNLLQRSGYISVGLRYNFSFARTGITVVRSKTTTLAVASASGSLLYSDKMHYLRASNQFSQGRGGIVLQAFLDYNDNGKPDKGEPKVNGLKVKVTGGQIEHNRRDSVISVAGLEAYANYVVEVDQYSFDNIGWQIRNPVISITVEPNHFQFIQVPIRVVGEVSGTVWFEAEKGTNGLGRMIVNFYNEQGKLVGKTLTESDGFFSFVGLPAGTYTARVDDDQLAQLNMKTHDVAPVTFTLKHTEEGDLVEGLRLVIQPKPSASKAKGDGSD
ncbi:MAG: Sporulation Domain-Containing Protein [Flaviaesturariibacter sp.]|nr:Sporulation Domain-Containing Protein [Flaviaesturariibacter sp.]